jgi:2,3-bisphosphoglycerate-independent phosphoglycerate mutase
MKLSIMRYMPMIMILLLFIIPLNASARCAVILIVDGLGSSYLPGHTATYEAGGLVEPIHMSSFERAGAQYQLRVPVPATEYGHAVIVTGYSNASKDMVAYYDATVFDTLRNDGYMALGILENGDSKEMLGELDVSVREKNDSIYNPYFEYTVNGKNIPDDVARMMRDYPRLQASKRGKDPYAPYISYNSWALGFSRDMVDFIAENEPGRDYILIVNVGGLDSAGQNLGYDGYRAVLTGMDGDIGALVDACEASGTVLLVTGDHGMSFPDGQKKGSHAALSVASRSESLLVPLLIYANMTPGYGGTYGQECLAPTLLSLLDEPDTMSLGDGDPLPVKEKPTLFLRSKSPVTVNVTGFHWGITASVDGIYRISGLEKGDYTVRYDNADHVIKLSHDELIDINEAAQETLPVSPWMAYGAAAIISTAGIVAALKLAWARK